MIEKLVWMKGMTLSTLARSEKFDILDVDDKAIQFRLHSNGREYKITKKELEWSWGELKGKGSLSLKEIYDSGSYVSAYIAAVLANMGGVSYKVSPIRLFYKEPK